MKKENIKILNYSKDEQGFVLVAALSCLVVLSLIGIAAMNTSNIEKNIAHNINLAEKTFYGADGGTEVGIEMIEWNLSCPLGFNQMNQANDGNPNNFYDIGGLRVADSQFAYDEDFSGLAWDPVSAGLPAGTPITVNDFPSDNARSIVIPETMTPLQNDGAPHTNIALFGITTLGAGSAVQMAAGYEGKGKGAAGGGAVIDYGVFAQTFGILNSEAVIRLGWRHLVGSEGECRPY